MKKGTLGGNASFYASQFYEEKAAKERELGRKLSTGEFEQEFYGGVEVR